jgi:hypothetical protein
LSDTPGEFQTIRLTTNYTVVLPKIRSEPETYLANVIDFKAQIARQG